MRNQLQQKIDVKTKPIGALGMLEELALQIGEIQNSLSPALSNPSIVVFAGDHGIAKQKVSAYPQEVTHQMVLNFLSGGSAINVFCKQHKINLTIVDAGVASKFEPNKKLVNCKAGLGTNSFLNSKAMSDEKFEECLENGKRLVAAIAEQKTNVIGFGEMGIGNTSASSMIMSYLSDVPLKDCIGKGTGLDQKQLTQKINILEQAKAFHGKIDNVKSIFSSFAGFEMAQMLGAMLEAYAQNMIILVDGFIASTVFLAAKKLQPSIQENAIFCHQSDEKGHKLLLNYLAAKPILKINLRLGEGTGCALAFPILQSAVNFLNEMASFESAGISKKIG